MKKMKENQKKKSEKYIRVAELKEENETIENMKKKKIMKKIHDLTIKCKLLETKKQKKREASLIEDHKKQIAVLNHLFKNQKEENSVRYGVLEYQREILSRSLDKENSLLLKRLIALYYIITYHLIHL